MVRNRVRTGAIGLVAAVMLAGCGEPIRILPGPGPAAPAPSGTAADGIETRPLNGTADFSVAGAEQACIAAGRERGLDVAGVVGSTAVTGSNGEQSRDVMLRVRRNGASIEVRCNYVAETRMARIMLI